MKQPAAIYKNQRLTNEGATYFEWLLENNLYEIIDKVFYPDDISGFNKEWLFDRLTVGEKYFKFEKFDHIVVTSKGYCYNTETGRMLKPTIVNRKDGTISGCYYYKGESRCIPKEFKDRGWEYGPDIEDNIRQARADLDALPLQRGRAKKRRIVTN